MGWSSPPSPSAPRPTTSWSARYPDSPSSRPVRASARRACAAARSFAPAAGQGALALECRVDDRETRRLVGAIDSQDAAVCVAAERGFLRGIGGDCNTPLAAHAELADGQLALRAVVTDPDGLRWLED